MTERSIILRAQQIQSARAGKRTHICLPAFYRAGRPPRFSKSGTRQLASATAHSPLRTPWQSLVAGDRLWVQEETATLWDARHILNSKSFFMADLAGGHVPIPGGAKRDRYSVRKVDARHLTREHSRYTLEVVGVRVFPCQEITWEQIAAEAAMHYATDSKGQWWFRQYGFTMPWSENPIVVGLSFRFLAESIDGVPAPPHEIERPAGGAAYIRERFPDPVKPEEEECPPSSE